LFGTPGKQFPAGVAGGCHATKESDLKPVRGCVGDCHDTSVCESME